MPNGLSIPHRPDCNAENLVLRSIVKHAQCFVHPSAVFSEQREYKDLTDHLKIT